MGRIDPGLIDEIHNETGMKKEAIKKTMERYPELFDEGGS